MTEALRALDEALAENDVSRVAAVLRHLVNAGGGVETLARNSGLKTPFLRRELAAEEGPRLKTLLALCETLDLRMLIVPKEKKEERRKIEGQNISPRK